MPVRPQSLTSVLHQLEQLGVDGLVGLPQHGDQVVDLFDIVGGKEGVGGARFATAGGSPDTVDIVLGGVRVVIIDDKFHIFNICKVLQCGKREGASGRFCTQQQPDQKDKLEGAPQEGARAEKKKCYKTKKRKSPGPEKTTPAVHHTAYPDSPINSQYQVTSDSFSAVRPPNVAVASSCARERTDVVLTHTH